MNYLKIEYINKLNINFYLIKDFTLRKLLQHQDTFQ